MFCPRIAQPAFSSYRLILNLTPGAHQQLFKRCKSAKEGSLTTSATKEVDTNVKPLAERVKENTKTVSYLGVILIGVAITGTMGYAIFRELFSSKSPNNVYSKAAEKCIGDPRVQDKLGRPITTFGEETRRGRRRHITHANYTGKDGRQHLRMQFYLKGTVHSATAQVDVVENDLGKYEYRYLFVEVDDLLKNTIIIEDNRHTSLSLGQSPNFEELRI